MLSNQAPKLYPFWQLMMLNIRPFFREPAALFWTFGLPIFIALLMVQAFSGSSELTTVNLVVSHSDKVEQAWLNSIKEDQQVNLVILNKKDSSSFSKLIGKTASGEIVPNPMLKILLAEYKSLLVLSPKGIYSTRNSEQQIQARNYLLRLRNQSLGTDIKHTKLSVKGYRYIDWIIPGIIVLQIIGLALFSISNGLVTDRQQGFFKRLKLSPFKRKDYIIGIVLARVFLLTFQLFSLLVAFYFLFDFAISGNWLSIAVILLLGSCCLCLIGVLVGARSTRVEVSTGISNLLYFPLMFLSGIYFDTANFPEIFQKIVQWLPSTAFLDAFRLVINDGASLAQVSQQITILSCTTILLFIIIYMTFNWGGEE